MEKPKTRKELLAELEALTKKQDDIKAALELDRKRELQLLVDVFKAQLDESEFTVEEACELLTGEVATVEAKNTISLPKDFQSSATYKDPNSDAIWVGGSKGPRPKWLHAALTSGKSFKDLLFKAAPESVKESVSDSISTDEAQKEPMNDSVSAKEEVTDNVTQRS